MFTFLKRSRKPSPAGRRASSFRPSFDTLEDRQMLSTSPLGSALMPTATYGAAKVASGVGFDQTYTVSVITIQNRTSGTVNFQLQWSGGTKTSYSLSPGQTMLYWISGSNRTAVISYDWSFQAGYQGQSYTLTSKNFAAGGFADLMPHWTTDGQQYYFTLNSARSGLNFFRV